MCVMCLFRGLPMKGDAMRPGIYFDGLGGVFIDPHEAEGRPGHLVRLSATDARLVRFRLREALLEAAARIAAPVRPRR